MKAHLKKFLAWRASFAHGHASRILLHVCVLIRCRKTNKAVFAKNGIAREIRAIGSWISLGLLG